MGGKRSRQAKGGARRSRGVTESHQGSRNADEKAGIRWNVPVLQEDFQAVVRTHGHEAPGFCGVMTANGDHADLKRARRERPVIDPTRIDRLPPNSEISEQGVLGCILLSPDECIAICIEKFKSGADVFYDMRHGHLYEVLVAMYDHKTAIDLLTLQQRLKDTNSLESVGGLAYVSSLPDTVPSAANLSSYVEIVLEKYFLRRMIQTCTSAVGRVYEHEGEVDELIGEVSADILKINQDRVTTECFSTPELVQRAITTIEDYHQRQGALTGIETGFTDFDKLTSGLHGGEMIVIAARPSLGKSSIAMNIADHVAVELQLPVGVFSLEMSADALMVRMLCSRARVNQRSMRDGFLADRDFPKLTSAAGKINHAPLYIDDSAGLSIMQLRAKAHRMSHQHGIKLFIIDYLQLMHSTRRKASNRQEEISDISIGVRALAKELNVPVIALAQLNRDVEREKRKPKLSDLRESGSLEQDADVVGLLYKPNINDDDGAEVQEQEAVPINLLIAKQRNGPTGEVYLTFLSGVTRFESAAKVSTEDVPQQDGLPYNDQ